MIPRLHPDFLTKPLTHRGLHDVSEGRPENSRAAIRAAIEMGYGIEIDLQLSADQTPMVFHDYGLHRLTAAAGAVSQLSANQLVRFNWLAAMKVFQIWLKFWVWSLAKHPC